MYSKPEQVLGKRKLIFQSSVSNEFSVSFWLHHTTFKDAYVKSYSEPYIVDFIGTINSTRWALRNQTLVHFVNAVLTVLINC